MSITSVLVKNIIDTTYDSLPVDAIEATKKQVLDSLGCIVAGSRVNHLRPLVDLVKEWGGREEASVVAYSGRVPAPKAALLNGTLAAVIDYDDTHDMYISHASRAVVPAALALAERNGSVSGKDFILAVALGTDLVFRISRARTLHLMKDPFFFCIPNFFGATAVAGKLLGLGGEEFINALRIVLQQVNGAGWHEPQGQTTKGMDGGYEAEAGINSALMAERGLAATGDPLEDRRGYYAAFHGGIYTPVLLTSDLGEAFLGTENSFKPYPCCRILHPSIDAALALVNKYDIEPDDIAQVTAYHGIIANSVFNNPDTQGNPINIIQSQFNFRWALSNAIMYRKVGIEHFTEDAIRDTNTIEMAGRITSRLNLELSTRPLVEPVIMEIKIRSGQAYSKRVDYAFGSPENPMSFDDIVGKFRDCCRYAVKPILTENIEKVVRMVADLENEDDAGQIARLLG